MNIHEYQAKELLAKFGVPVPAGHAAMSVDEAVEAANKLPGPLWVVKAQIHAGGRGKGKFTELGPDAKGGVRLARSVEEAVDLASSIGYPVAIKVASPDIVHKTEAKAVVVETSRCRRGSRPLLVMLLRSHRWRRSDRNHDNRKCEFLHNPHPLLRPIRWRSTS